MMRILSYFLTLFILGFISNADAQTIELFTERAENIISKIDNHEYQNIDGIMLWKDDIVIAEKFWNNWNKTKPHMLQSVSKSITSLLIGIAIHEGYISDTNQKVLDFFPSYRPIANLDEHKKALTIEDLLTMRTGMDWNEHPYQGSNLAKMNSNRNDWIRFVLDTPMKEEPGQTYSYNSGGVILLAGVIEKASGMSVQEFAQKYLFEPLGIGSAEWWFSDHQGLPHTGGGLNLAAMDMIKTGLLILQKGEWDSQKILSEEYVETLFQNHITDKLRDVQGYQLGYSYLWHVFPIDPNQNFESTEKFIAAWGAEGQWIFVLPSYDVVIIFIGDTKNFREETQPIEIIYKDLLDSKNTY